MRPGSLEEGGIEGAQALADGVQLHAKRERHGGREHGVLHVVGRATLERRGDQVSPQQREMWLPLRS